MDFINVINKRRSVRNFLPDPISDEVMVELLEAVRLEPSDEIEQ